MIRNSILLTCILVTLIFASLLEAESGSSRKSTVKREKKIHPTKSQVKNSGPKPRARKKRSSAEKVQTERKEREPKEINTSGTQCDPWFENYLLRQPAPEGASNSLCENKSKETPTTWSFAALGGLSSQKSEEPAQNRALLIHPNCIHAAIDLAPSSKSHPNFKIFNCESSFQNLNPKGPRAYKPCDKDMKLSQQIAVHFHEALSCLQSIRPLNISGEEIFKLVAHESRFIPNVANYGGMGLMQLTGIAAQEVQRKGSSGNKLFSEMMNSKHPSCEYFQNPPDLIKNHQILREGKNAKICQFISPDANPKRSVIYALALYSAYKEDSLSWIGQDINKLMNVGYDSYRELEGFRTELTRMSYNLGQKFTRMAWQHYLNYLSKNPDLLPKIKFPLENALRAEKKSEKSPALKFLSAIVDKLVGKPPLLKDQVEEDSEEIEVKKIREDLSVEAGKLNPEQTDKIREFFHNLKVKAGDPKYTTRIDSDYIKIRERSFGLNKPCKF